MVQKRVDIPVRTPGAKNATAAFNKIGSSIGAVALKYVGLTAVLFGAIRLVKSATEKYKIQELAEKRLEVSIGKRSKALLEQAAALQKTTSFADEEIIQGQALIAAFVKEEDAIKKATVATLDLAAAKGFDLKSAADLVSKTLGSSTNALTRYGIAVEGAVGSTERLESLTGNIARAFGGQAAAAMETMAGRSENLSNSWGDLLEKGGRLIDIIDRSTGGQDLFAKKLDATADELEIIGNFLERVFGAPREKQITAQEKAVARLKDVMSTLTDVQREQVKIEGDHLSGKIKLALALQAQNVANAELLKREGDFKTALVAKIAKQKEEKVWTDEVTFALWRQNEAIATNIDVSKIQIQQGEELGEIWQFASSEANNLHDDWLDAQLDMIEVGQRFGDMFAGVLERSLLTSGNVFDAIAENFKNMINQMVATLAANATIFGIFTALGIPGAGSLFGGGSLLGLLGFQHGGSFKVGGQGGADSQLVAFRASPGEQVDITPQGQTNNNITIQFNGPISDKRYIQQVVIPEIQKSIRQGVV